MFSDSIGKESSLESSLEDEKIPIQTNANIAIVTPTIIKIFWYFLFRISFSVSGLISTIASLANKPKTPVFPWCLTSILTLFLSSAKSFKPFSIASSVVFPLYIVIISPTFFNLNLYKSLILYIIQKHVYVNNFFTLLSDFLYFDIELIPSI